MKTLAGRAEQAELVDRLRRVRSGSAPRWGRMSAHQMICHLGDCLRMALDQRSVSPAPRGLPPVLVKWIALYLPIAWPKGIPSRPETDQESEGTPPGDFAADVEQVAGLLDLFTSRPVQAVWPSHPVFGRMSGADWYRWSYLHMDHHLRQFDC